jgi:tetratricopeptide (TPR) repeat protein
MKKTVVIAAVILLLGPVALSAQIQGRGKLRGIILDADTGKPLPGVTVKAYCEVVDAYYQPSPVTDKDGAWRAVFIRTGMWKLDFEKIGYIPQKLSTRVNYDPGVLEKPLEIKLQVIKGLVVKESIAGLVEKADKLFSEKKYGEARVSYEKLLADNPDLYVLNKNIGNCWFAAEDYPKAIEAYMLVFQKQPDRADILAAIAHSYNNSGQKEKAAEWYKKVPFEQVTDIDTAYNAGILIYGTGEAAEAARYFKKAVAIDPEFADGWYQLGMASAALNSPDDAVAALKKFLQLAPDSPQAPTAKAVMEALIKKSPAGGPR